MFSATWPEEIQNLSKDFMNNAVHFQIEEMDNSKNQKIKQIYELIPENLKKERYNYYFKYDFIYNLIIINKAIKSK